MNGIEIQVETQADILKEVIFNISNYEKISCMNEDFKQRTFQNIERIKENMTLFKSNFDIKIVKDKENMSNYDRQLRREIISLQEIAENIKEYIETNNNEMLKVTIQEFNEKC